MNSSDFIEMATILVVDDSPDDLLLMSNLLRNNYRVKIASTGETALRIAASDEPPDLILLDVMMQDMNGYEVCQQLKKNTKTMNIPIIFVSAMSQIKDEARGLELGAIDYITKPISPPIVMARVKNHLMLKAMSDFLRDQNDWDMAERLAFTLKGVSGNVSITGLQQFVDKLDAAIDERRARKQGNVTPGEAPSQPVNLKENLEQKLLGQP